LTKLTRTEGGQVSRMVDGFMVGPVGKTVGNKLRMLRSRVVSFFKMSVLRTPTTHQFHHICTIIVPYEYTSTPLPTSHFLSSSLLAAKQSQAKQAKLSKQASQETRRGRLISKGGAVLCV
jgi:hypothetical protein